MPWWGWVVVGALLLGAELAFIDAQFYLVFVGAAALLVGFFGLGGVVLPEWAQWLSFAVLSIVSMVLFRRQLYETLRKHNEQLVSGPAGEQVLVPTDLSPGASCRLEYRGSTWTAQNVSDQVIPAEANARIVQVEGLTLQIRPAK